MSLLTAVIILLLIIVIVGVVVAADDKENSSGHVDLEKRGDVLLIEANRRVKHILVMSGYDGVKYRLRSHDKKSFTRNKEEVHVCTSCLTSSKSTVPKLDRFLYVSLHEVSHVISTSQDHDAHWEMVFKKLLRKACDLGYLDRSRLKI